MGAMQDVCVRCGLAMVVGDVGVAVIEMAYDPPEPYTIRNADTRVCPFCGTEIVCRSTMGKEVGNWDKGFQERVKLAEEGEEKGYLRVVRVYEGVASAPKVCCGDCVFFDRYNGPGELGACCALKGRVVTVRADRKEPCGLFLRRKDLEEEES